MAAARTLAAMAILWILAGTLVGCAGRPGTPPETTATPAATASAATATPADGPGLPTPPEADLAVEGGDPVAGQLGTFVWADGGSDSPWLPGAPIRAATGEILSVSLMPGVAMSHWSALLAPAASSGGAGAIDVGSGSAPARVVSPQAGSWTLAVTLDFGDAGSATYFWLLEVS